MLIVHRLNDEGCTTKTYKLRNRNIGPPSKGSNTRSIRGARIERLPVIRDACESTYSPFQNMIPELLSEIFLFCRTQGPTLLPDDARETLILCQICSHWRKVAFGTPRLWSDVCFDSLRDDSYNLRTEVAFDDAVLELMETWLACAGPTSPLTVSLSASGVSTRINLLDSLIIPHIRRIRELHLDLPEKRFLRPLFTCLTGSVELLEQVSLHIIVSSNLMENMWNDSLPIKVFKRAPRLRSVSIIVDGTASGGMPPDEWTRRFLLPYSQLTYLEMKSFARHPSRVLQILRQCPNLARCVVHMAEDPFHRFLILNSAMKPIILVDLSVFELVVDNKGALDYLLGKLTLPALKHISVRVGTPSSIAWPHSTFNVLSRRSAFTLESFCFDGVIMGQGEALWLMKEMPLLSTFRVSSIRGLDSVFWKTLANVDSPLLPRLRTLQIREAHQHGDVGSFSAEDVANVIRSRWWTGENYRTKVCRLEFVRVLLAREVNLERVIVQFMAWRREGLGVEMLMPSTFA